jgi:hypothetical protein
MKDSMNVPCPPAPPTPQQAPQQYFQQPPPAVPVLPQFQQTLMTVCQNFQQDPSPPMSSSTDVTYIHYVMTSVKERMSCPFSLCESLDHFTYQCPMIIEYRRHQMALIRNPPSTSLPVMQVIPPIPSPDIVHITSPEPESLPTPLWFMDRLYEDFPPNPPNSPVHFPQEILPPTTISNPHCLDIWFMSRTPSHHSCDTPSTSSPPEDNHAVIVTNVPSSDPLYSHIFHCDEDILEELTTPDFPWNSLHHKVPFIS